jgi:hypothetical protein
MSSTYQIIRQAIIDKNQIIADYDGYHREMCPHVIGRKQGREQALFYQFGGDSKSGLDTTPDSPSNWRCIPIEGLSGVSAQSGNWYSAPNHSRPQTCVDEIDVDVSF